MSERTTELSPAYLRDVERRCNAATAGPWKSYIEGRDHTSGDSFIQTPSDDIYLTGGTSADQDFIAQARNDVPALLAEIRRLQHLLASHKQTV